MHVVVGASAMLSAALVGCTGTVWEPTARGTPGGRGNPVMSEAVVEFECTDAARADSTPLQRLTREQYEHALRDLVEASMGSDADDVFDDVRDALDRVPDEPSSRLQPFATMDQTVSDGHVQGYLDVGRALGDALTRTPARLDWLLACDGAAASACLDAFIRRFGRVAFRRPLEADEAAFLETVLETDTLDAAAIADVVAVTVNLPQFIYRLEHGTTQVADQPDTYQLDDHEVAARLAAVLYASIPDEALLAAAERGELSDDATYAEHVDRMLDDPRSDAGLRVFVREWLQLENVPPFDLVGAPSYAAFAADHVPSTDLRAAMIEEIIDSLLYHLRRGDPFEAWFRSPYAFARSAELAAIYGVEPWDGTGEPPRFPAGERAGLLTRAGLLANNTSATRPIMRGVFIRELILCDELGPPEPGAMNAPLDASRERTTREVVEMLTEQPGTSCATCHVPWINGLGFPFESYDALGRTRSVERVFDEDGELLAELPIETSAVPGVVLDDPTVVEDADALVTEMVASRKLEACFARQYARYVSGEHEDLVEDGCRLEALRTVLADGGSMRDAVRAYLLDPTFRQRVIREEPEP